MTISSFLASLNEVTANPSAIKQYITEKDKKFEITHKKSSKNINTQNINDYLKKSYEAFNSKNNFRRLQDLTILDTQITQYKARFNSSKNGFVELLKKIFCCCFDMRSDEEIELESIHDLVKKALGQGDYRAPDPVGDTLSAKFKDRINLLERCLASKNQIDPDIGPKRYNLFKMKLFDSKIFKSELQGLEQDLALKSYVDDLFRFIGSGEFTQLNHEQQNKVVRLHAELNFALEIVVLRAIYEAENVPAEKKKVLDEINKRIMKELKNLGKDEYLVIPGGYLYIDKANSANCKGHAVLYAIKKGENGTAEFTIVDTGEGAEGRKGNVVDALKEVREQTFAEIKESKLVVGVISLISSRPQKHAAQMTNDTKVDHIPLDKLNEEFFSFLIDTHKRKTTTTMIDVRNEITGKLMSFGGTAAIGRLHHQQHNDSCSVKSVSAFMPLRLDRESVKRIKVSITENEIDNFKTLSGIDPGYTETLKKEAASILVHRREKMDKEITRIQKLNEKAVGKAEKEEKKKEARETDLKKKQDRKAKEKQKEAAKKANEAAKKQAKQEAKAAARKRKKDEKKENASSRGGGK